jgi:hypothetical protein
MMNSSMHLKVVDLVAAEAAVPEVQEDLVTVVEVVVD